MLEHVEKVNIETLVPHKGAMCLLDRVLAYGEDWISTESTVTDENLFLTEYGLPSWVGIEYMAQSISALAGVRQIEKGEKIRIGFLLGTRKYTVNTSHFPVGSVLRIKAQEIIWGENGLGAFDCVLEAENFRAEASLNVFQPERVQDFLEGKDNDGNSTGHRLK